jgi:hypothetical protein
LLLGTQARDANALCVLQDNRAQEFVLVGLCHDE